MYSCDSDVPFAHACPRDLGAARRRPQRAVAGVAGQDVRRQRLERQVGILHRPQRVAGVDADPDHVRSGGFDQPGELACLHVAGVILDRDLHARLERPLSDVFQDLDRIGDARLDSTRGYAVAEGPDDAADERRSENPGDLEHRNQLRFCIARGRVEDGGARADGQHAHFELDPERVGPAAETLQRPGVGRPEQSGLTEVHDLDAARRTEVENAHRRKTLRPQAEHIESETRGCHAGIIRNATSGPAGPLVRSSARPDQRIPDQRIAARSQRTSGLGSRTSGSRLDPCN